MPSSRIHCTARVQRAAKKSRHRIAEACDMVSRVLSLNPHYGVVVRGHPSLRKMRVKAPGLTTGKSGGYRRIYATRIVDECHYLVLLDLYYKGEPEDLDPGDYEALSRDAASVLGNVIDHGWTP